MASRIETHPKTISSLAPGSISHALRTAPPLPAEAASPVEWLCVEVNQALEVPRRPRVLTPEAFYPLAYPAMFLSRRLDERLLDLFRKGYVKGTVTSGVGNEATMVGAAMPLRPGEDVAALLHRDLGAHLLLGATPYRLVCQYMANAASPTHGREGNVHHGDAAGRRMPMISHLGRMLSVAVGATWAARRQGEDVFGLAVIGDGGSSTGEFHEAINLAAVHRVPVLFLVENNHYSFSTPTELQYRCKDLSDRAAGYGIAGKTIDGTDVWEVYTTVQQALAMMQADPEPMILECRTLRLQGHAAYDKGDYVPREQLDAWRQRDPLPAARQRLLDVTGCNESGVAGLEAEIEATIEHAVRDALRVARPDPKRHAWISYCTSARSHVAPFAAPKAKNGDAVRLALSYLLEHNSRAFLAGQDVGVYGSAFKTCKGLIERFGPERVMDLPICESATVGFALGASQTGAEPIIEFQFADFSTEAATQIGLNAATWFFRAGRPAPILMRLPCGGGLSVGPFHSGEFKGLWSCFAGLKLLYPATPQETFEALLAGFYDRNPCLVLEHKLLYWSQSGPIEFDGNLAEVWRPRRYTEGDKLTLVAFGAAVHDALAAAEEVGGGIEVWNPFVLRPLNLEPIRRSVEKTGRLLVVQECAPSAGIGHRLIGQLSCEGGFSLQCPPELLAAPDTPTPFAPELESFYRSNPGKIATAIRRMVEI